MNLRMILNRLFIALRPIALLFAALSLFTIGCKEVKNSKESPTPSITADVSTSSPDKWPSADSIVDGIPLYEKFDDIEPLFRLENDTTYIVNFWATWCKPCLEELPYFESFNSSLDEEKVKVVLVSLDFPKKIKSNLIPYVKKKELKSKVVVLLDGNYNEWIDKVSPDWSGAIPITYIYNRKKSHLVSVPFENVEELNEAVRPFL